MRSAPLLLLASLLSGPSALAADDNELMEQVDEDAFEDDYGDDEEQWAVPSGDAKPTDPDAMGEDPDEGIEPDLAPEDPDEGIDPGGDDMGEDPPEDLRTPTRPAPAARAPAPSALDTNGKAPLSGAFSVKVVGTDLDAVTVELPVLVAQTASSFEGDGFWLVAEFSVKGRKVGEARHLVSKDTLSDLSPTVAWVKAHVPVLEDNGAVEVAVRKETEGGDSADLFKKSVDYRL